MKIKKVKDNLDLFFLTFSGELVEVTTSTTIFVNETDEKNNKIVESELPLTIRGYILDKDSQFYYLGDTPSEITHAVKKTVVNYISIVKEKHVYDEILDDMPSPENDNDVN